MGRMPALHLKGAPDGLKDHESVCPAKQRCRHPLAYLAAKPGCAAQPYPAFTFLGPFHVIHEEHMGAVGPRFTFFPNEWQRVRELFM